MVYCSPSAIGKRIASLRNIAKGGKITQAELADQLGYSREKIAKFESGKQAPAPDELFAISGFFSVTTDYLISGIKADNREAASDFDLSDKAIDFLKAIAAAEDNNPIVNNAVEKEDREFAEVMKNREGIKDYLVSTGLAVYPKDILFTVNWLLSNPLGKLLLSEIYQYITADVASAHVTEYNEETDTQKEIPVSLISFKTGNRNYDTAIESGMFVFALQAAIDRTLFDIRTKVLNLPQTPQEALKQFRQETKEAADNAEETR